MAVSYLEIKRGSTGPQGNRVNKKKFNAKAPGRPRTAKTARTHSHCWTLLPTIGRP